jgi:hypothetical protein
MILLTSHPGPSYTLFLSQIRQIELQALCGLFIQGSVHSNFWQLFKASGVFSTCGLDLCTMGFLLNHTWVLEVNIL